MKEIQLTRGKVAIVDDEDFEFLNAFKWYAERGRYTFYATHHVRQLGEQPKVERMHCAVLSRKLGRALTKGEQSDHDNGNGLDNRRPNLFSATHSQNQRNRWRRKANSTSRYLGVSWHERSGKWMAQICVSWQSVYLGVHCTEFEAAMARETYIAAHPELRARSNFTTKQEGE